MYQSFRKVLNVLSEDVDGWQICDEALFFEKYLSVNMKNALWVCKIFQWKKPGSEQNCSFSPKRSQCETSSWHIHLSHVEDPGSRPSRNLNLGFLHSGGCPGNGTGLDHVSMGFKKSQTILFFFPGQHEDSLGTLKFSTTDKSVSLKSLLCTPFFGKFLGDWISRVSYKLNTSQGQIYPWHILVDFQVGLITSRIEFGQ